MAVGYGLVMTHDYMITGASCAALSFGSSALALSWKWLPGVISKGSKEGKGVAGKGSKGAKAPGKGKGNGKGKSPATGSARVGSRHADLKSRREPRRCTTARTASPCSKPPFGNLRPGVCQFCKVWAVKQAPTEPAAAKP